MNKKIQEIREEYRNYMKFLHGSTSSQVFSGEAEDKIVSLIQENINHRMFYVTSEIKKLTEEQSKLYVIIDLISDFKEGEATNGL